MTQALHVEFAQLWSDLNPKLAELLAEAEQLRHLRGSGSITESIGDMHERMVMTLADIERLEEIRGQIGRVRMRAEQAEDDAKAAYQQKKAETITGSKPVEYSTAEERAANYDVKAATEKLAWRKTQRQLRSVKEADEYVSLLHWGLREAYRAIDTRFRMLTAEHRYETN